MGASTVAGATGIPPIKTDCDTGFRACVVAGGSSAFTELSQNLRTFLFYPVTQQQKALAEARAEICVDLRRELLLRRFRFGVLAAEALDASGGVHELLLAGEKWMASRADFNVNVALVSRTGRKVVTTRA
jgi:hypothetical protein